MTLKPPFRGVGGWNKLGRHTIFMGVGGGISWDHTQSPRKKRLLIPRALVPCVPQPHDYTTARPHDKKRDPSGSLGNYLFNKLISGCQRVSLRRT